MAKIAEVREVSLESLRPYERNAKIHGKDQIEKLKDSIREFGFVSPCLIDREHNLIAGHGRVMAAKELGMEKVPCVFVEGLSEEQRRAYILADNRLGEMGEWDRALVMDELTELADEDFDITLTGFEVDGGGEWFVDHERWDGSVQEGNDEYNGFLEKFEIKKTTDDCYTPDNIYEVVADWVSAEYGVDKGKFVRPFFPGGDYEHHKYPKGCVVVDNPPFSILSAIIDFYVERGIKFFIFAPGLATLNYVGRKNVCAICVYIGITYENGASVPTSFLTNLGDGSIAARSVPILYQALDEANDVNEKAMRKQLPKYEYPDEVLTAAKLGWLARYGQEISIKRSESVIIRQLDAMEEVDKGIYGCGLLISERAAAERAAAERAAAERAAAHKWKLSDREKAIVKGLGEVSENGE